MEVESSIQEFNYEDLEGARLCSKQLVYVRGKESTTQFSFTKDNINKVIPDLYNVTNIKNSTDKDTIYFVENERDVETLKSIGLLATTTYDKANFKFKDNRYLELFKNRDVVVIPDLDEYGLKYANNIATILVNSGYPNSVKIFDLSIPSKKLFEDIPNGFNITDYLENKAQLMENFNDLRKIFNEIVASNLNQVPEFVPERIEQDKKDRNDRNTKQDRKYRLRRNDLKTILSTDYPPKRYIIEKLIPENSFICLSGKPKVGKSLMAEQLACAVVSNEETFLGEKLNLRGDVIWFDLENDDPERKNRALTFLKSINEMPYNVKFYDYEEGDTPKILEEDGFMTDLEIAYQETENPVLIIIDPLNEIRSSSGSKNFGLHEGDELRKLRHFQRTHNITILVITHNVKGQFGDSFDAINGSTNSAAKYDILYSLTGGSDRKEDFTLNAIGRYSLLDDLKLEKVDYKWEVIGTKKEIDYKNNQENFFNDPYYKAVQLGLSKYDGEFNVTSKEFRYYLAKVQGKVLEQIEAANTVTAQIKKRINQFEEFGNIHYSFDQSGSTHTKTHTFIRMEIEDFEVIEEDEQFSYI